MKPVDNGCPLTMYSVYYREIQSHETEASWQDVRINDNLKTYHVLPLRCDAHYVIEMSAWNELGQSNRSRSFNIKTNSGKFRRIKYLEPFACLLESPMVFSYVNLTGEGRELPDKFSSKPFFFFLTYQGFCIIADLSKKSQTIR